MIPRWSSAMQRAFEGVAAAAPNADQDAIRGVMQQVPVHVHVGPLADQTRQKHQEIQTYVLLNLLPRMFGNVSCSGIDPASFFNPESGHGSLIAVQNKLPPEAVVIALVDDPISAGASRVVYADSRGWTGYLSTRQPWRESSGPFNPIGAYFAGAWAVADVFNRVLQPWFPRAEPLDGTWTFDLVTLHENERPNFTPNIENLNLDLQNLGVVGLGSVGQAFVDVLSQLPSVTGTVELIDHEVTDAGNEARYVLSYPNNRSAFKVLIARDRLANAFPFLRVDTNGPFISTKHIVQNLAIHELSALRVMEQMKTAPAVTVPATTYEVYYDRYRRDRPFDIVVSSVDSEQTRRNIQFGLPRLVLNAWTDTGNQRLAYAVGVHSISGKYACLACIYHAKPRDHEPTTEEFIHDLTGWPLEVVKERLASGDYKTSSQEIAKLAAGRGLPPKQLEALVGKTLKEILHMPGCGLAALGGTDREIAAQVFHVPVLAGCHLATQLVLQLLEHPSPLQPLAQFDANLLPSRNAAAAQRPKVNDCFCGAAGVRDVFKKIWGG